MIAALPIHDFGDRRMPARDRLNRRPKRLAPRPAMSGKELSHDASGRPMSEDMTMHFPKKADRAFDWNINTLLALVTLIGMLFTAAGYWFGVRNDVAYIVDWKKEIEGEMKERRGVVEGAIARAVTQTATLDDRVDQHDALIARLSDRLSANEARSAEFAQSLRELQASINEQSGDLKVIRAWIEEQRRQERTER